MVQPGCTSGEAFVFGPMSGPSPLVTKTKLNGRPWCRTRGGRCGATSHGTDSQYSSQSRSLVLFLCFPDLARYVQRRCVHIVRASTPCMQPSGVLWEYWGYSTRTGFKSAGAAAVAVAIVAVVGTPYTSSVSR